MRKLRILFIGNSHTYYNDMPDMVARRFREQGYDCEVTMIAHGGWFLEQHVQEPDVKFNILHGHYDYVVLQEHSHPFGPEEKLFNAVRQLNEWICEANAKTLLYMTWAKKDEPDQQERMTKAFYQIAEEIGAMLAPVGELWWQYRKEHPEVEMYADDNAHASKEGSEFAACCIWNTIQKNEKENGEKKGIDGNDMIVNLYRLPTLEDRKDTIQIKRAFAGDKEAILTFIKENFSNSWVYEAEHALLQEVPKCFIAVENKKVIGFACFDSSAKGFFGPIGVLSNYRGKKVGQSLLLKTLYAMKEYGYGYAIIGWVSDAELFYRKTIGAELIKGGNPENSVYSNMISI